MTTKTSQLGTKSLSNSCCWLLSSLTVDCYSVDRANNLAMACRWCRRGRPEVPRATAETTGGAQCDLTRNSDGRELPACGRNYYYTIRVTKSPLPCYGVAEPVSVLLRTPQSVLKSIVAALPNKTCRMLTAN